MDDNTSISCLNCGAKMSSCVERGISIDVCGDCGGVWLDSGELDKLIGSEFHVGPDTHRRHDDDPEEDAGERELEDELGDLLDTIVEAVVGDNAGDDRDTSGGESDRASESSEETERQPVRTSIGRNTSYLSGPVAEHYQTGERTDRRRVSEGQSDEAVNWELIQTLLRVQGDDNERIGRRRIEPDIGSANVTIRFKDDSEFEWSLESALESGSLSHLDVEPEQFQEATDEILEWIERDPKNAAGLVLQPERALAEALGPEAAWVSDLGPPRSTSDSIQADQIASLRVETETTSLEGD